MLLDCLGCLLQYRRITFLGGVKDLYTEPGVAFIFPVPLLSCSAAGVGKGYF